MKGGGLIALQRFEVLHENFFFNHKRARQFQCNANRKYLSDHKEKSQKFLKKIWKNLSNSYIVKWNFTTVQCKRAPLTVTPWIITIFLAKYGNHASSASVGAAVFRIDYDLRRIKTVLTKFGHCNISLLLPSPSTFDHGWPFPFSAVRIRSSFGRAGRAAQSDKEAVPFKFFSAGIQTFEVSILGQLKVRAIDKINQNSVWVCGKRDPRIGKLSNNILL